MSEQPVPPVISGQSKSTWFALLAVGIALLIMAMWGMQRRSEAIGLLADTQRTLDARPADDALVAQIAREARAELVAEFQQRVPKYGVQELGMFAIGLVMFFAGLIGVTRAGKQPSPQEPPRE